MNLLLRPHLHFNLFEKFYALGGYFENRNILFYGHVFE